MGMRPRTKLTTALRTLPANFLLMGGVAGATLALGAPAQAADTTTPDGRSATGRVQTTRGRGFKNFSGDPLVTLRAGTRLASISVALLATLIVAAGLGGMPVAVAAATDVGDLAGVVTKPGGVGLSAVTVSVTTIEGAAVASVSSASDGSYSFVGLDAGAYLVRFSGSGYITTWYGGGEDRVSATSVSVTGGASTTVAQQMTVGGRITGTFTRNGKSTYATIEAFTANGARVGMATVDPGTTGPCALTGVCAPPGAFTLALSSEKPVLVRAVADDETQIEHWYPDAYSSGTATAVQVGAGNTLSGINLSSPGVATLAGFVTNSDGTHMAGYVTAHVDDHGTPVPVGARDASSTRTGGYTLKVPAARVTARATGYAGQDHWIPRFLGDAGSAAEATYLTPGAGETRTADVAVAGGQHVGGAVTVMDNGSPAPSGGVTVTAYSSYGGYAISHTVTAADGSFDLDGLSAWSFGNVRLTFTGVGLQDAAGGATLPLDGTPGWAGWTQVQVDPDYPRLYPTSPPTISGDPMAGQTLTVTPATWNYDGGLTRSYEWLCNYQPLGAVGTSYQVQPADEGCVFQVEETAAAPDRRPQRSASPYVWYSPRIESAGPARIIGTPVVGTALNAEAQWTLEPDSVMYTWLRDGSPILGAELAAYEPSSADAGHEVSVLVSATRVRGTASEQSAATLVKARSTVSASATGKPGYAVVKVRLSTPGVLRPGGLIRITTSGRLLASLRVTSKTPVTLSSKIALGAGRRELTATYGGGKFATAAKDKMDVRVLRRS